MPYTFPWAWVMEDTKVSNDVRMERRDGSLMLLKELVSFISFSMPL